MYNVYTRITVSVSDALPLNEDRNTAVAEIAGNMSDYTWVEAVEGSDFAAHIARGPVLALCSEDSAAGVALTARAGCETVGDK